MAWSVDAWSRAPYGAGFGTELAPPAGEITDPTTGATWLYTPNPLLAWSLRGWSGGNTPVSYPGGGVVLTPLPEAGVMRVQAWWPDAPALQLRRVLGDGSALPVRGASPLVPTTATRRNVCTNPSVETATTGWAAADGSPTLTRPSTPPVPHGASFLRATIAGAGACGVTAPGTLTGGTAVTVSADVAVSGVPSALQVVITWLTGSGGSAGSTTTSLTADQIIYSVGQWHRQVWPVTPPPSAATGTVKILASGLGAGATVDLDGVVLEAGATDGSYFDGGTFGATWLGTAHASGSVLAPVLSVDDGECPLDEPVRYLLVNPAITGGTMLSEQGLLESLGRQWLTHPGSPGSPIVFDLRETPAVTYPLPQGVFRPINRTNAVVVSAARRQSAQADRIAFNVISRAEYEQLTALLADVQPVLLRTPSWSTMPSRWVALGALTEDVEGRKTWQDAWLLSAPFVQVDPPSALAA